MQRGAIVWAAAMAVVVGTCVYLARAGNDDEKKPSTATDFKPVTTVERMMEGQDLLFEGVKQAIRDEKWGDGVTQAWILAELANVNTHQSAETKYVGFAQDMSKKCAALAQTLRKRNKDDAKAAAKAVADSCTTCHDQYKNKRERRPQGR